MELSRKQLVRANRVMFVTVLVLCIIMGVTNIGLLAQNGHFLHVFLIAFFTVSAIVISVSFKLFKEDKKAMYVMSIVWIIMSVLGTFSVGVNNTYSVGFTVMIVSVVYVNVKLTTVINISTAIIYILDFIYLVAIKHEVLDEKHVSMLFMMTPIVFVATILITKLFQRMSIENAQELKERIEAQGYIVNEVSLTTDKVSGIFKDIVSNLAIINDEADRNRLSTR